MEILQLPIFALLEKIETELNSNPVLEIEESEESSETERSPNISEGGETGEVQQPGQSDLPKPQEIGTGEGESKQTGNHGGLAIVELSLDLSGLSRKGG